MLDGTRDHARSYHLHRLATALDTKGLHASVKTTYPAALHIFIPGATMLPGLVVLMAFAHPWNSP